MSNNLEILGKKWERVAMSGVFAQRVPNVQGVYLVVINNTYLGIPVETSVKYVGRSKSLKRRFLAHNNYLSSHNRDLYKLIRTNDRVEFWFQKLAKSKDSEVKNIEKELIRGLTSFYNLTNKIVYN